MEMIIGGAFQGKMALAKERHPEVTWLDGSTCSLKELLEAKGVHSFHGFIREQLRRGEDLEGLAELMAQKNPNLIIISDEVGYGVVPIDAFDRSWREAVGRVCTRLAALSERVIRVTCGVGVVIKGD